MLRRMLAVFCGTALAFVLASARAEEPKKGKADRGETPKIDPKAVADDAAIQQDELRRRFDDFKAALERLATRLEKSGLASDKDKAKKLRDAIEFASGGKQGIDGKFLTLIAALKDPDTFKAVQKLSDVERKNAELQKDLRLLVEMLLKDDRDKQLKEERERIARLLEQLKEVIGKQERIRAQTELARLEKGKLGDEQKKVTNATSKLAKTDKDGSSKHEKSEAKYSTNKNGTNGEAKPDTKDNKGDNHTEGKPTEGDKGDKPGSENKPSDKGDKSDKPGSENKGNDKGDKPSEGKGDAKPAEGKPGNPNKADAKPGENKANGDKKEGGKPSDGKGGESKDGGKPSEAKGGEGKPGDGKGDPKGGDGKGEGKPGDSKGGDGKPGEGKPGEGKPGAGKGGDGAGKPGEAKDNGNKAGDSKPGDPKNGGDPKQAGKPGEGKDASGTTKPATGKPGAGNKEPGKPSEKKPGDPKAGNGPANGKMNNKPNSNPSEAKGGAGKPGEPKPGQDQKGTGDGKGEGKPGSSGKPGPMGQPGPKSSGQPKSGQPGPQGQPKPSGGQQQAPPAEDNPIKKQIQDSNKYQGNAEKEIEKGNNKKASDQQDAALEELKKAQKTLEELLKQLREEEMERLLAKLQERCEYMLRKQIEVKNATVAIAADLGDKKIAQLNAEAKDQLFKNTNRQKDAELEIIKEADGAIKLIQAEGTAIAFAEVFLGVKSDMVSVATRLGLPDVGKVTVAIENDIIEALRDMIDALKKAREENKDPGKPKPPGPKGPPADPKLLDMITELKLILSRQMRVNERTKLYKQQYEGEQALKELPKDPKERARIENIAEEVKDLSKQQDKLKKVTNDIYKGKNKAQGE